MKSTVTDVVTAEVGARTRAPRTLGALAQVRFDLYFFFKFVLLVDFNEPGPYRAPVAANRLERHSTRTCA